MRKPMLFTLTLLPALAHAHPGHGDAGVLDGLVHPFSGLDHLLGIAVAGVLLGMLPRQSRWAVCAAFLVMLGATHALWSPQSAQTGFIAGLLAASATPIAAGMAATKLARLTAAAAR